ncbi:MAG: hypothetical protein C4525_09150 [Desulfarculus sp.]|nr:MAG: hypothetical protein C4525_09150 [Desulfarculus sp.]
MEDVKRLEFLRQLASAGAKANMWRAGEAVGLDHAATEQLSLDLMAQGLLEMASLSGAVRLTESGQAELDGAPSPDKAADLGAVLREINETRGLGLEEPAAADLKADLATLQAALQRRAPHAAVLETCLKAVAAALAKAAGPAAAALSEKLARFAAKKS